MKTRSRRDRRRGAILDQSDRFAQNAHARARPDAVLGEVAAERASAGHAVKSANEMPCHRM
jgi:hypothetical protein